MSVSHNITAWKDKAAVDYFALFVPLWLAFDAWCKDKYGLPTQRDCLESLKQDELNNTTYQLMVALLQGTDSKSDTFKSHLVQLHQALEATPIQYEGENDKYLTFRTALTDRSNSIYENLIKTSGQHDKIELIEDFFITDEIGKVYRGYIEILYQVRCALIHGDMAPSYENEQIVMFLYLTLRDLMEQI